MTTQENKIMHRVLTLGPNLKVGGGMNAVLTTYKRYLPGFHHIATNSPYGTFVGLLAAATAFLRMPFERLCGRNILHVHTASGKSFVRKYWLMRWGKFLGFKVVYHCHSGASKQYFRSIGIPRAKKKLSVASAIVVLSDSWREYFESTFKFKNIHVINNPVAIPVKPTKPAEDEPLSLLFLGMIVDNKGIFDLVDTLAANRERWRGRVLLRVGGSGEVERLKQIIADNDLADMVEFIGWVSGSVKDMAFASSHILILPSYFEGLPVSVLEGMAYGKPIIATPVGGIPEVVHSHENGILVPPGDRKALAEAIDCYLLNPELIDRHGRRSRQAAMPFSPEAITNQLLDLYRNI